MISCPPSPFQCWVNEHMKQTIFSPEIKELLAKAFAGGREFEAMQKMQPNPVARILIAEDYYPVMEWMDGVDPVLLDNHYLYTAPPQRELPGMTADDLREPNNGKNWRVEWWNESCRMLLPSDMRLDSFQSYRNGTLQFTIKLREKNGG